MPKATLNPSPPTGFTQPPKVPTSEVPIPEVPSNVETPRRQIGRESTQYWKVDAIEGAIKEIKVKVREVNNIPNGLHIIVDFDEQGMAYGDAQGLLVGFCGTLAVDCNLFPMDYERWSGASGVPKTYFDDYFETIIKELCRRNKVIRSKQVIPHTGGSKANSRRRHEMLLETGELPSREKLYIETHKRKDGSFVNNAARALVEQIEVGLSQSTIDESEVSPLDVVGKVLGPEHSGRVRCMGMGAVPTNTFRNTRLRVSSLSLSSFDAPHHLHPLTSGKGKTPT
ncbi:putative transposase, Ptta/En/Spm, plant [Sesbania bispinosa]|nr:putative transposase, Ptta/En/Spm, plant [Sesbania bispinosa]